MNLLQLGSYILVIVSLGSTAEIPAASSEFDEEFAKLINIDNEFGKYFNTRNVIIEVSSGDDVLGGVISSLVGDDGKPIFIKREVCNISSNEISELQQSIEKIFDKSYAHTKQKLECEYIYKNENNCDELVQLIKCGVDHLTTIMSKTKDQATLQELQTMFQELLINYEKEIDRAKSTVSQAYQQLLINLKSRIQDLKKTLTIIEDTIITLRNGTLGLCIMKIVNGKIVEADSAYKQLHSKELLPKIVITAYDFLGYGSGVTGKTPEEFLNLLLFIQGLTTQDELIEAEKSLFDVMKMKKLNSDEALLFYMSAAIVKKKRDCHRFHKLDATTVDNLAFMAEIEKAAKESGLNFKLITVMFGWSLGFETKVGDDLNEINKKLEIFKTMVKRTKYFFNADTSKYEHNGVIKSSVAFGPNKWPCGRQ